MPELRSIQMGDDAFEFRRYGPTTLIMRGAPSAMQSHTDLPRLTTLTTNGTKSTSFCNPQTIVLQSASFSMELPSDMPKLVNVELRKVAFSKYHTLVRMSVSAWVE